MSSDFTDLEIYQLSERLTLKVYALLPNLPPEERYALGTQLRRCVASIGANIAEGCGRYHYGDKIRFMYNARGSLMKTRHFLLVGKKLSYFSEEEVLPLLEEVRDLGVKLNNYISFLNEKAENERSN